MIDMYKKISKGRIKPQNEGVTSQVKKLWPTGCIYYPA
jgi:hypothetical protein